jgi:hypothetical protein
MKSEESSANSLIFADILSVKSFIYIKKRRGPAPTLEVLPRI